MWLSQKGYPHRNEGNRVDTGKGVGRKISTAGRGTTEKKTKKIAKNTEK